MSEASSPSPPQTPDHSGSQIRRVGVVFSGGPAPAANAVICSAVMSFRRQGREVLGFRHGYGSLQSFGDELPRLEAEKHYFRFEDHHLRGLRNARGIIIGTARANPGKDIHGAADLRIPEKTRRLDNVYRALCELEVDALISIGGDDTLKTANFLHEYQKTLPADAKRIRVVHLPKTIDNDYRGIDFTFGFFTAVDFMAQELLNLRADAMATGSYFIVETMGRKAGWLSYGVAIAGEAHLVVAVEDVRGELALKEVVRDGRGEREEQRLNLEALADRIVDLILTREHRGKQYGTVVLAEGLAEMLPQSFLDGVSRDEHGHISLGKIDIGKLVAQLVSERFEARTGRKKKLTGVQLGYESRCSVPHAFDVMLGSQLGVGAYRALVEEGLDGHMVSVTGQLDLQFVPFSALVDPETLLTEVRFVSPESDFHRLARMLGTRVVPQR
ncbi:MAG: 6-phosphofructokinase [Myxococcales bacterium]|nr:6-phosphofructokinase [Myxococcales bacterium]